MFKVVIIDDEPIIVKGITKVVPWEKYDCQVAGTASNGLEGRQVIEKIKPDIVFTDIAMPGLDGLGMIAALRVEYPDMMVCILTGYRDFDYAQTALHLGVSRFLLKPSNMEEIVEAVEYMTGKLKKRREEAPKETAENTAENTAETKAGSFIVKNAIEYISGHYTEKLTLGKVAEMTYVSQWHLSKMLNKYTGKSFSDILNQTRVEAAKELLKDPALRISDVAEKVGFMDVAHFSRVFKKFCGVSANEYRNQI